MTIHRTIICGQGQEHRYVKCDKCGLEKSISTAEHGHWILSPKEDLCPGCRDKLSCPPPVKQNIGIPITKMEEQLGRADKLLNDLNMALYELDGVKDYFPEFTMPSFLDTTWKRLREYLLDKAKEVSDEQE